MHEQKIYELQSARTYGIIGIILEFIGDPLDIIFHGLGFIVSIIGLILLFIAIKSISNYYSNQNPFKYMLYSLISGIILAVVAGISIFLLVIPILNSAASNGSTSTLDTSLLSILLLIVLLVLVPSIVSIIFQYMAYDSAGKLTGIHEFHTAALLLLIGIILAIIVIGIFLILIGIIFLIIAFAKLPGEASPAVNDQNFNQDNHQEIF